MWRYYETHSGRAYYEQTGRTHSDYSYSGTQTFYQSSDSQRAAAGISSTNRSYPGSASYTEQTVALTNSSSRRFSNANHGNSSAREYGNSAGTTRELTRSYTTGNNSWRETRTGGNVVSSSDSSSGETTTYTSTSQVAATSTATQETTTSRADTTVTATKARTVHAATSNTAGEPTTTRATVTETHTTKSHTSASITTTVLQSATFARSLGLDTVIEMPSSQWGWTVDSITPASAIGPLSDVGGSFTRSTFTEVAGSTALPVPSGALTHTSANTYPAMLTASSIATWRFGFSTQSTSDNIYESFATTTTRATVTYTGNTADVGDFEYDEMLQWPAPGTSESGFVGGSVATTQTLTLSSTRVDYTKSWSYPASAVLSTRSTTYTLQSLDTADQLQSYTTSTTHLTERGFWTSTGACSHSFSTTNYGQVARWGTSRSTQESSTQPITAHAVPNYGGASWLAAGAPFGWFSVPGEDGVAGTNLAPSPSFPVFAETAKAFQSPLDPWEGPVAISVPILYQEPRTGYVDDDGTPRTVTTSYNAAESRIHATSSATAVESSQTVTTTASQAIDLVQEGSVTRAPYLTYQGHGSGLGGWGRMSSESLILSLTGGLVYTHHQATGSTTGAVAVSADFSTFALGPGEALAIDRQPILSNTYTASKGDARTLSFSAFPAS